MPIAKLASVKYNNNNNNNNNHNKQVGVKGKVVPVLN
jgi:hypothetical protein